MFSEDTKNVDVPTDPLAALSDCKEQLEVALYRADNGWNRVNELIEAANNFIEEVNNECDLSQFDSYQPLIDLGCDNVLEKEYIAEGRITIDFTVNFRSSDCHEDVETLMKEECDSVDFSYQLFSTIRDSSYFEIDDFDTDNIEISVDVQEN